MRSALRTAILLLSLTASTTTLAAPPEASPAVTEAARARVKEGIVLYGKKKYDRAHAAFLQAYALSKNTTLLINLGLTSLKLAHPLQAAGYFNRFVKEAKDATPEQKARADKGLADARMALGAIDVIAPEGAEISLDGEVVGRAPLGGPVDVLPGRHEVTSTTTSGTKSETVTVGLGAIAKARLGAQGRAAPPPNAVLEPEHGASTPSPSSPAAPPSAGGDESSSSGIFAPPATTWPVYTMGAVGIVSFTTAIVLGGIGANADHNVTNASDALARNDKSPASCLAPDPTIAATCSTLASAQRTSSDVKTPFAASLAVGAGATLFAVGWWFFAPKTNATKDSPAALRVTPTVSPHGDPGAVLDVVF